MSVAIIDAKIVTEFVNDNEEFKKCVNKQFDMFDVNKDGVLSRDELQNRIGNFSSVEFELQSKDEIKDIYDVVFDKFDVDRSGTIDREEFRSLMKELMLAKARGIGNFPISIILQGDSLLMRAVERQSSKK